MSFNGKYYRKNLTKLNDLINKFNIKSIAMPPLGCNGGNGNLKWINVVKLIEKTIYKNKNLKDIFVYLNNEKFAGKNKINVSKNESYIVENDLLNLIYFDFCINLKNPDVKNLNKAAFLLNKELHKDYFKFKIKDDRIFCKSINDYNIFNKFEKDNYKNIRNKLYKNCDQSIRDEFNHMKITILDICERVNILDF